ncbi:O-antigen/teichoic acid export membrane protein [Actinomycetospora succinea]|uniref:O-antigen/teichoic acid export membrane protein n=1 Tax=Actinomycetospora succinea TaxID=663603 RepID=A0A4R6UYW1_9PSEU|nr:O-antigen/teichoic acid export membrane protein [Actinomycetospora succinea]
MSLSLVRAARSRRDLSTALVIQLAVRVVGIAGGIAVAAGLARGLGHEQFGQFSLMLLLLSIAINVGDLGLTTTVVRQLTVRPDAEASIVGALVVARSMTGLLGAAFVAIGFAVLEPAPDARLVAVLGAATLLLMPLSSLQTVGQAKLHVQAQNALLLMQSILWTTAVIVLAATHASLLAFGIAFCAVNVVQSVVTWAMFRRLAPPSFAAVWSTLRPILMIAAPVALGGLFVASYYRAGGVVLYAFRGAGEAADYSAGARVLDILQVVPATLLSVVLPLLSSTWRDDSPAARERRSRLFALALKSVMLAAVPIAVGGALLSSSLSVLVYGNEFASSGPVLAVLLLSFPAICAGYVATGLALACGRTGLFCAIAACVAAVTIPVNLLVVPVGGASATAWVTVIAEYAVAIVTFAALRRGTGVSFPFAAWARTLVAAGVMALAVLPLRDAPVVLSVLVGAIVFAIAGLAVRAVTLEDLRLLADRREREWA